MLSKMLEKVFIVGAGMTGATISSLLRNEFKQAISITVVDKSRGIGGRMATSRCSKDGNLTVDLGAQYFSATPNFQQKHARYYQELLAAQVLQPLQTPIEGHTDKESGTKHYVTPSGSSAIVKHFLNKSDADFIKGHAVTEVSIVTDKVKVSTDQGHSQLYDGVVLTMPVPQILQLKGDIQKLIDNQNLRGNLEAVSYSSRFAVGLFFSPNSSFDVAWGAKYITDNPCVRYVSIDNRKRGKDSSACQSICIHTGAPWGIENIDMDKDVAAGEIIKHLQAAGLPVLPEPLEVKGHKWRYSQVHQSYTGSPGCLVLSEKPAIILAGDAFTHSNMDGCIDSALATHRALKGIHFA